MIANDKINGRFIDAVNALCEEEKALHSVRVAYVVRCFCLCFVLFIHSLSHTDSVYLIQVRYFLNCYEFCHCIFLCAIWSLSFVEAIRSAFVFYFTHCCRRRRRRRHHHRFMPVDKRKTGEAGNVRSLHYSHSTERLKTNFHRNENLLSEFEIGNGHPIGICIYTIFKLNFSES